jgi:hypothetical protein
MLGRVDAGAAGEHLLVQALDLADAGTLLGGLLVGDELVARRADRGRRARVETKVGGPGSRETE